MDGMRTVECGSAPSNNCFYRSVLASLRPELYPDPSTNERLSIDSAGLRRRATRELAKDAHLLQLGASSTPSRTAREYLRAHWDGEMADSPQIEATARALRSRILVYNDYGRGDVRVHEFGRGYGGGPARVYYYFDRQGGADQAGHYRMVAESRPPPPKRGLMQTIGSLFVDNGEYDDYDDLEESFKTGLMIRGL
eukprot:jgi/Mesvir1/10352/Mv10553-RA.1